VILKLQIGSTTNKGDELMLLAIAEHLGGNYRFLVDTGRVDGRLVGSLELYRQLGESGLSLLSWGKRLLRHPTAGLASTVRYVALRSTRFENGYALDTDAAGLVDASGFAYGDPWGSGPAERMVKIAAGFHKRGKPVVMLPQSFGPFDDETLRATFLRLLQHVDILYARDRASYEHVVRLTGPCDEVRMAPDYTILVDGIPPSDRQLLGSRYACIIPSHRMLDSAGDTAAADYIPFLTTCTEMLQQRDIRPLVIMHDTKHDYGVARRLRDAIGEEMMIVDEQDARVVKGIIGQSHLVISSRFHGLVSGLSQGVPCIATEWTHKFQALMDSYRCGSFVLSPTDAHEMLREKLCLLDDEAARLEVIRRIEQVAEKQRVATIEMWHAVEKVLQVC